VISGETRFTEKIIKYGAGVVPISFGRWPAKSLVIAGHPSAR